MNRKTYDTIFIGASVFSAAACGAEDLIIESGAVPAREYAASLRCVAAPEYACATSDGLDFRRELEARNILSPRGYTPAPLAPVTANRLAFKDRECWFLSRIAKIEREGDGYNVEVVNHGKTYLLRTKKLVDSTASFEARAHIGARVEIEFERSLNAILVSNSPECQAARLDSECADKASFVNGANGDEIIMRFPVAGCDLGAAREALCAFWETRPQALAGLKLASLASELDIEPSVNGLDCGNFLWIPPTRFASPDEAYDAGALLATGIPPRLEAGVSAPGSGAPRFNHGRFDVIVVGLGTAGSVAACRAASLGLKTLGIEALPAPGGTAVACEIAGSYYGIKGGYYARLDRAATAIQARFSESCVCSGTLAKSMALERALRESGVEAHYRCAFADVTLDCKSVSGVSWVDGEGRHIASAAYTIDCTADDDVCAAAGCEMQGGQEIGEHFQTYSNVCRRFYGEAGRARYCGIDDGVVNQYDPRDFGRAVLTSSCSPLHLWPDYSGNVKYAAMAALTGLREGLRIRGEETARLADFCDQTKCDNPVYYGYSNLDNHAKDDAFESREYRDWITICGMWGYNVVIPVPAGALIPRGYEGLLAAGRGVSVDHALATGLRMKDDVQKSGEAAAVTAWLSIRRACRAKDAPYAELRSALEATGCLFDIDARLCTRQIDGGGGFPQLVAPGWYRDPYTILDRLSSPAPGFAMWSAKLLRGEAGRELEAALTGEMKGRDGEPEYACALALALRGNSACEETLLRMISDRSGRAPENGWTHNNLYCVSAISAAGRLGLRSAAPQLEEIVLNSRCADDIALCHDGSDYEFMTSPQDVYFQLFTHAFVALYEIALAHPELKESIRATLERAAHGAEDICQVSLVCRRDKRLNARKSLEAILARLR